MKEFQGNSQCKERNLPHACQKKQNTLLHDLLECRALHSYTTNSTSGFEKSSLALPAQHSRILARLKTRRDHSPY